MSWVNAEVTNLPMLTPFPLEEGVSWAAHGSIHIHQNTTPFLHLPGYAIIPGTWLSESGTQWHGIMGLHLLRIIA